MGVVVALLVGCGGDGGSGGGGGGTVGGGAEVARESGCIGCHGAHGQGAIGPAWTGLAGSTVQLEDGTTKVADRAYIRRSIVEPGADVVAGATTQMPKIDLSEAEVDALVRYIESLR